MTFLLEGKGDRAGGMGVGGVRVCVGTVVWCTSSGGGRERDERSGAGVREWARRSFLTRTRIYSISNYHYYCFFMCIIINE